VQFFPFGSLAFIEMSSTSRPPAGKKVIVKKEYYFSFDEEKYNQLVQHYFYNNEFQVTKGVRLAPVRMRDGVPLANYEELSKYFVKLFRASNKKDLPKSEHHHLSRTLYDYLVRLEKSEIYLEVETPHVPGFQGVPDLIDLTDQEKEFIDLLDDDSDGEEELVKKWSQVSVKKEKEADDDGTADVPMDDHAQQSTANQDDDVLMDDLDQQNTVERSECTQQKQNTIDLTNLSSSETNNLQPKQCNLLALPTTTARFFLRQVNDLDAEGDHYGSGMNTFDKTALESSILLHGRPYEYARKKKLIKEVTDIFLGSHAHVNTALKKGRDDIAKGKYGAFSDAYNALGAFFGMTKNQIDRISDPKLRGLAWTLALRLGDDKAANRAKFVELCTIFLELCGQGATEALRYERTRGFVEYFRDYVLHHQKLPVMHKVKGSGDYELWKKAFDLEKVSASIPKELFVSSFTGATDAAKKLTFKWAVEQAVFAQMFGSICLMEGYYFQLRALQRATEEAKNGSALFPYHYASAVFHDLAKENWCYSAGPYGFEDKSGNWVETTPRTIAELDDYMVRNLHLHADGLPWNIPMTADIGVKRNGHSPRAFPSIREHLHDPTIVTDGNWPTETSSSLNKSLWPVKKNRSKVSGDLAGSATDAQNGGAEFLEKIDHLEDPREKVSALMKHMAAGISKALDQNAKMSDMDLLKVCRNLVQTHIVLGELGRQDEQIVMSKAKEWLLHTEGTATVNLERIAMNDSISPYLERIHKFGKSLAKSIGHYYRPRQDHFDFHNVERLIESFVDTKSNNNMKSAKEVSGFGYASYNLVSIHPTKLALLSAARVWSEGKDERIATFMKEVLCRFASGSEQGIPLPSTPVERSLTGCLHSIKHFKLMRFLSSSSSSSIIQCCFNLGDVEHCRTDFVLAMKLQFVDVAGFPYWASSIVDGCRVAHEGVTMIVSYFPVRVQTFEPDHGPPVEKLLVALVQEYGDMTLYDKICEIHHRIVEKRKSCSEGRIDEDTFNAMLYQTLHEIWEIVLQLSSTIAALSAAKVIHRGLNPENIVRTGNNWKLADFSEARFLPDVVDDLSNGHGSSDSEVYLPPVKHGTHFNHDSYALGCVLYEMLFGVGCIPYRKECRSESWMVAAFSRTFRTNDDGIHPKLNNIVKDFARVASIMVSKCKAENVCSVEPSVAKDLIEGLRSHFEKDRQVEQVAAQSKPRAATKAISGSGKSSGEAIPIEDD
jgi:serine/threonine protein kinase